MEPEGRPLTPGTSYGPPAFLSCTSQSSCSPGARCSWGSEPTEAAGPERRFRSSAFPSSLSWDSDSERDALDEEELQHFSNPHGLAAHSPGSPSSGLRFDSEDEHEPELLHLQSPTNPCSPVVRRSRESTKAEEPNRARPGPTHLSDSEVWSVSEGAELFLSNVKPKDVCQMEEEAENREGEKSLKGKESKEPERDVYTFPGDSDPESPPPAPWAHCTFIQRCKKKRVLLRPFSGLGHIKRSVPEAGKRARGSPQKSKTAEAARSSRRGGVHDFEEAMEKPIKFTDRGGKKDKAESVQEPGTEIFTCVECSIYFKKQVHLQEHMVEHMVEHCRSASGGSRRPGKGGRFRCVECGWNLPSRLALTDHHKRHQESRLKILEEIEKLNENEKPDEAQNSLMSPEPAVTQDTGSAPGKVSGPEMVTSPDPAPTPEADPAVVESDTSPPNSGRTSAPARNVSAYRRRFICSKCNFSARTPQALANHSKTHNRKKAAPRPPLACGRCAFLTSSPTVLREHQRVHPGEVPNSGEPADEPEPRSASNVGAGTFKPVLASDEFSDSGLLPNAAQGQRQGSTARPGGRRVFNRRFSRGGKTFARDFEPRLDGHRLPGGEEDEKDEGQDTELCQQMAHSPGALEPCIRASRDDGSAAASLPPNNAQDEGEREPGEDAKVFFLRRSTRVVAAAAADGGSEDDDSGDERLQRFLSEGVWDEDDDETDAGAEALRSVERKCPYCPDRFHNGIGLANHVRGHLNRVGVSYNVRHFISPEEVNAIEKKFSYQKKKKKVANFDPGTFSVMHCEFCGAGFDTRAGLSSHARAHLRDFGITNWDVTVSPIHILRELFSSRPDLVIPTAPPRSLASPQQEDDEEPEDEEEGVIEVKLEGETTERTVSASVCAALTSASPQRWKEEERGGDEEEAAEEDDDEELQLPGPGKTGLSRADSGSLSPGEDADAKGHNLKCEVCGAQFETRRGLSSHARSHLRQLGIGVSESSGAPIDLLYQIAKERDVGGQSDSPPPEARPAKGSSPQKDEDLDDMDLDEKPIPFSILTKAVPPSSSTPPASPAASPEPPRLASPSPVVRKAPISSLLPVSSPLRSPEHKAGGLKGSTSGLSVPAAATAAKPLWAPQESDAPLNLALDVDPNKDIVCQLCGAWFETRKGLSSHARAHLRHFGVEYSESKGSPIDLLNQLIETDDFKHKASALQPDGRAEARGLGSSVSASKQTLLSVSSSSLHFKVSADGGRSTSKATSASGSSLLAPPTKRLKSSSMQVFRLSSGELMALPHSEPPKEIGCEFCGEYFENRKGLSSHARSHLRQMGITEWSVNGSPIDTLRDIITRRGLPCALPLKPLKTPPPSSPGPPRSPLSTSSSPPATLISRHPFAFARPSSPPQLTGSKSSPTPPASSGGLVLKLKPEPVQLDVSAQGAVGRTQSFPSEALNWRNDGVFPLNLAMAHEVEPTRDIRCEFCGEYFENRKGLSSHARSHLRQMGITEWSVNGSPIDTLREVMHKRGLGASSHSDRGVKKESSQWDNAAAAGTSEGLAVSGYQPCKFRKSPLSLLQSGSRLHKQGLPAGPTAAPSGGRFFRVSPLGKRPQSEGGQSGETPHSSPHSPKNFSPLPHDFSFKRKPSPDKHGHQDPSCELCGFYFENRKALASHARAHLRQFGVTEWCVNGSPIETLSAWMRSRPQKVLEMHRSYMQGNRSTLKKKASSSSSSSQWSSSLAVSLVRPLSREASQGSSKAAESEAGANRPAAAVRPGLPRLAGGLPLQAQVARSELNVRLPRGFERRPLKHPSCPEGAERDPPKPPRTGTVPALVPKPPTYPLVKLVGKFYTLKCRFCEVEFHGPLSVQEDWIRHLQQHILKMNYNKPAAPKAASAEPPAPAQPAAPTSPSPTPPAERAPMVTATDIVKASEEQPALCPTPLPLPTQSV